jgi:hypothetical protein
LAEEKEKGKREKEKLKKSTAGNRTEGREEFPSFCDFDCPHAEFGDPAAVGACRRDIGVWCGEMKRYNTKNALCIALNSAPGYARGGKSPKR